MPVDWNKDLSVFFSPLQFCANIRVFHNKKVCEICQIKNVIFSSWPLLEFVHINKYFIAAQAESRSWLLDLTEIAHRKKLSITINF